MRAWDIALAFLVYGIVAVCCNSVGIPISSCQEILSLSNIDSFAAAPLDYATYKQWPQLEPIQKLVYLVDRSYLKNLKAEFLGLLPADSETTMATVGQEEELHSIPFAYLAEQWKDFTSMKSIEKLFKECDRNLDNSMDWMEFLMCRAIYNQYGAPYDVSEIDYLENIVLFDFQQRLNNPLDPMTQELLARDEL